MTAVDDDDLPAFSLFAPPDHSKCVHYREGGCVNPFRCKGGYKIVERRGVFAVKTCSVGGDIPFRRPIFIPGIV